MLLNNLSVRTGLMLAQLAVALAALFAVVLGWNTMRSNSDALDILDRLSVQQNSLVKDAYVQLLRSTVRLDIVAAQHRAGDTAGAQETSRTTQAFLDDAAQKMELFKSIPAVHDGNAQRKADLSAKFTAFLDGLEIMHTALDNGDLDRYQQLKTTQTSSRERGVFV